MATKTSKSPTKSKAENKPVKARDGDQPAKKSRAVKAAQPPVAEHAPAQASTQDAAANKKLSALDAAALVLAEAREPMNCRRMIEAMAAKGYWTSPGGKTPASTLYAAILKEIVTKDNASRFRKTARGKFART